MWKKVFQISKASHSNLQDPWMKGQITTQRQSMRKKSKIVQIIIIWNHVKIFIKTSYELKTNISIA